MCPRMPGVRSGTRRPYAGVSCGMVVVVAMVSLVAVLAGPAADADSKTPLGGGAGIVVDGSYCTLTTIGRDSNGELVGFTAAHCGGPGAQVVAEGSNAVLGSVAAADDGLDYAVIKFDPAKVTAIANFDGFAINGIGLRPVPGQPACKQGAATGGQCDYVKYMGQITANLGSSWQPGDDGGPVSSDGLLIGMIRNGYMHPHFVVPSLDPEIKFTFFSAILDDVNAKGGPGAGFTPVSA